MSELAPLLTASEVLAVYDWRRVGPRPGARQHPSLSAEDCLAAALAHIAVGYSKREPALVTSGPVKPVRFSMEDAASFYH